VDATIWLHGGETGAAAAEGWLGEEAIGFENRGSVLRNQNLNQSEIRIWGFGFDLRNKKLWF
jgi:hypothetical protein